MDLPGNDSSIAPEKRDENSVNYHSSNMSTEWQLNDAKLSNTSMGMMPPGNSLVEPSASSSAAVLDSFSPPVWDHASNAHNLGFRDMNVQNNSASSNTLGTGTSGLRPGMGWISPNAMPSGNMFLTGVPGMLLESLPQFADDSGFIERAARFSCFSGGNFGDMMNPFSVPHPMNPYSRGVLAPMQGRHDVLSADRLKSMPEMQYQKREMNTAEGSKEVSRPVEHRSEGSPLKNEKSDNLRSHDEAKHGVSVLNNVSDEAEFSGRGGQEELEDVAGESSAKSFDSKKRKRNGQDPELKEGTATPQPSIDKPKDRTEIQQKGDQNPPSTSSKPGGKNGKQGSQGSDQPKEEYIHVRARRGQATNSHSLAERVRREKISERMKFLQDLVPGCSKVTGKAVMLDEIINYVQSLQRQVEFLSMKLATVNPRLDFNVEGLLAKDLLQSRAGLPSSLAFPTDMTMPFPQLHPSQSGLIQGGLHGLGNSSDAIRRSINSQLPTISGGFRESTSQVQNPWEDELHNIVQMGFPSSAPLSGQDISGSSILDVPDRTLSRS